ncbi:MAG: flippase [Cyanobacteria bacterium J06632_3]
MTDASITSSLKSKLIKGAAGTFGLRLMYTALTFGSSVVFARMLGSEGFGLYTFAVVWAYLLSIPATLGFDSFIVREMAVYRGRRQWGLMRGLLRWVNETVLGVSAGLALIAIIVAWLLIPEDASNTFWALCIAMVFMPALSLRNTRRGAMRGLHAVVKGVLPEFLIDPLILIGLTLLAYGFLQEALSPLWVVLFYGMGTTLTLIILNGFLNRELPAAVKAAKPVFQAKYWLSSALPFILIESIPIINSRTDVLMIGLFQDVNAVGLYVPVNRGGQMIGFILMAVGSTLAPMVARAYSDGRLSDLQSTITKSVRAVVLVAFLFSVAFIVGGRWYLLLFGEEFLPGQRALSILCVGKFIATSVGLSHLVLNMTGHERYAANVAWMMTLLNVILNAIFIPAWGVDGAALATSISLVSGGLASLMAVRGKLGIDMTLMGRSVAAIEKEMPLDAEDPWDEPWKGRALLKREDSSGGDVSREQASSAGNLLTDEEERLTHNPHEQRKNHRQIKRNRQGRIIGRGRASGRRRRSSGRRK